MSLLLSLHIYYSQLDRYTEFQKNKYPPISIWNSFSCVTPGHSFCRHGVCACGTAGMCARHRGGPGDGHRAARQGDGPGGEGHSAGDRGTAGDSGLGDLRRRPKWRDVDQTPMGEKPTTPKNETFEKKTWIIKNKNKYNWWMFFFIKGRIHIIFVICWRNRLTNMNM